MFRASSIRAARAAILVAAATALAASVPAAAAASGGAGCPNEQVRAENHSTQLPDCRAYELVTPPYKEGYAFSDPVISADGLRMFDSSPGTFSGAELDTAGGIGSDPPNSVMYELARGETAWTTTPVAPAPAAQFLNGAMQLEAGPDLGRTLWRLQTPSEPEGEGALYRRESDGEFVRMGPLQPASVAPLFGGEGKYLGASEDFTHVLITKEPKQGRWPGDTTAGQRSLYEYGGADEPEPLLVAVKNEGRLASNEAAQLISQCGAVLGAQVFTGGDSHNAISASGEAVFFTALAGPECGTPSVNELYARVGEAHTVALSEPVLPPGQQCTGVCATAEHRPGVFVGASEDGSKVFFTTEQPLLNSDRDTTKDLYMAELEGAAIKRLVMVSEGETAGAPGENDRTPGKGANVEGVLGVSADGSHVYFVATGVLTEAANVLGVKPGEGAQNLYVTDTDTGRTKFIAQTDGGDPAAVTPDGGVLVLVSGADLTGEAGVDGEQVYKYEASSGSLTRISIGQHSSSGQLAPSIVVPVYEQSDPVSAAHSALTMSSDGSYVFFESPDALTPRTLDDQVVSCQREEAGICFVPVYAANVYEYHEGTVSLIVTDRFGERPSLISTDETGRDVFFRTAESLVPGDTDTQEDIYDARIDGGFPAASTATGCSGEACRGPLSATPPFSAPGSATQAGETSPIAPALTAEPTVNPRAKAKSKRCNKGFVEKKVKKREQCVKVTGKKKGRKANRANDDRRPGQ